MLNEDLIEMAFIDQLTCQGFEFHHGPDIAPDSDYESDSDYYQWQYETDYGWENFSIDNCISLNSSQSKT